MNKMHTMMVLLFGLTILVLVPEAFADTVTFSDDFERVDSLTLGSNWTMVSQSDWSLVGGDVVNQVHIHTTPRSNVANPIGKIDGDFSVSTDSVYSGPNTGYSDSLQFQIQVNGLCYHARYRRLNGVLHIAKYGPSLAFAAEGLVYAAGSGVTANTNDLIRLAVTGDNAGNCTIAVSNVTQSTGFSSAFTTYTDNAGAPHTNLVLTGGQLGFDSTDSYTAGHLHYKSFTATAVVPDRMVTFSDDFDRSDSSTLGPNWTMVSETDWSLVGSNVVNQLHIHTTPRSNVANLIGKIDGYYSVSTDSVYAGSNTRYADGLQFHIQANGLCYHLRYKRSSGVLHIAKYGPSLGFAAEGLLYAASSGVTANTTDLIRLTVTGDNAGNCTIALANVTQGTKFYDTFETDTDHTGSPHGNPVLTGGQLGFDSTDSSSADHLHYQSFTAAAVVHPTGIIIIIK